MPSFNDFGLVANVRRKKAVFANDMILVKKSRSTMERTLRNLSLLFSQVKGKPSSPILMKYLLADVAFPRKKFIY